MSTPVRELILQAIAARLSYLTAANGYGLDLGSARVYRNVPVFDRGEVPAACLWDTGREERTLRNSAAHRLMQLQIDVAVGLTADAGQGDVSALANAYLADLETVLGIPDATLDAIVDSLEITGIQVFASRDGDEFFGFSIFMDCVFITERGDPYTQVTI